MSMATIETSEGIELTEQEWFACGVRRAIVKITQEEGCTGLPEAVVDGIELQLGQSEDGPCWYCPELYGIELVELLQSAREKGVKI